jgi:cell division septal protein FtsQ
MTARGTVLLILVGVGLVLAGAAASPRALRHLDGFMVRQVEVRGTRYLAPDEAVRASGITRNANLFDDLAPWKEALERHALVAAVRIDRVVPATLRLVVTEKQPIALLAQGEVAGAGAVSLRAVAADGRILPIDLTTADLDLPVVSAPATATAPKGGVVGDEGMLSTLRLLERLRREEPALYDWISAAVPLRDGAGVSVRLRSPAGAEALLSMDPQQVQLQELKIALADLAARAELGRLVRVDARFREQIVTRISNE